MIEKELKVILSEEEYQNIEKLFEWDSRFYQTNYYYKQKDDIFDCNGITIRIREIYNKYSLQVKVPIEIRGSLHIKKEYELAVSGISDVIEGPTLVKLTNLEFHDAHLIGSLTTERRICNKYLGVEICLDKSSYLNKNDYELEVEYIQDYPESIVKMLSEAGINFRDNVVGKFSRFIDQYIQQEKK